jgi:hypothetical protein
MRDNYYRLGEGFLCVYSITMRDTFNAVNRFYDHILQVKGRDEVRSLIYQIKSNVDLTCAVLCYVGSFNSRWQQMRS